jgi:hypothetical protein
LVSTVQGDIPKFKDKSTLNGEKSKYGDNLLQIFDSISDAKSRTNNNPLDPLCLIQKSNYEKLLAHIEDLHREIDDLKMALKICEDDKKYITEEGIRKLKPLMEAKNKLVIELEQSNYNFTSINRDFEKYRNESRHEIQSLKDKLQDQEHFQRIES